MGATRPACTMNAHGRLRRCPVVVALYSHYSSTRDWPRAAPARTSRLFALPAAAHQLAKHRRGPRDIGCTAKSPPIVQIVGENR